MEQNTAEKKSYFTSDELGAFFTRLKAIDGDRKLPDHDSLLNLADKATTVLETEDKSYRPVSSEKKSGGLLDFKSDQFCNLPVIVVPDLHGRSDFLIRLLSKKITIGEEKISVLNALNQSRVIVICVGDGVHAESRAYERWCRAYDFWLKECYDSKPMREEMEENLATMQIVMELKCAFPAVFHFLKGNHENILDEEGNGNHSFRKFALEGEMVLDFMREVYSDAIVHLINCFEKSLPVCVTAWNCFVSHAEPAFELKKKDIINYHSNFQVVLALTWTANDQAEEGSVRKTELNLNSRAKSHRMLWFAGHRPVDGRYLLRQDGLFVQIHNPDQMNVAVVPFDRDFDFEKDIISV